MGAKQGLGEMEHFVLLMVVRLGDDAYGMRIAEDLADGTGRDVAIGSVYAALDRLERRGYVTSRLGEPSPERGGRAKRYFSVRRLGLEALAESRAIYTRLWEGIALDLERHR